MTNTPHTQTCAAPTKVTFYRIKENGAKTRILCQKAEDAFKQEKRLLIVTPNLQAAQYVDALLWRSPPESFIPHIITEKAANEFLIAITTQEQCNVNHAAWIFHLCPAPFQFTGQSGHVEEVFEFYDETDPGKTALSEERMAAYRSRGWVVRNPVSS